MHFGAFWPLLFFGLFFASIPFAGRLGEELHPSGIEPEPAASETTSIALFIRHKLQCNDFVMVFG